MAQFSPIVIKRTVKFPKIAVKAETKKLQLAQTKTIISATQKAVQRYETKLSQALDNAMEASVWGWPRTTIRVNGSEAGDPRDIIDTSALKKSKVLITKFGSTQASVSVEYRSPYANITHYGGYIKPYGKSGRKAVYLPGRPWIDAVLNGTNGQEKVSLVDMVNETVKAEWRARFG